MKHLKSKLTLHGLPVRKGDFIRFKEDIGPFPEGIYRFESGDESAWAFKVGSGVSMFVTTNALDRMEKVPEMIGLSQQLSQDDFLDKYYPLMKERRGRPFSVDSPVTGCFLSPAVAREVH